MEILTVADCHGRLRESELLETLDGRKPDVIFFLGDNEYNDIECVKENLKGIQMFGILGNHDSPDILERTEIENLHLKIVSYDGFLIGGFGGSIRYKNDSSHLLFTNEESEELLKDFPYADILITHDKPCFRTVKHKEEKEQEQEEIPKTLFQRIRELFAKPDTKSYEETEEPEEPDSELITVTAHSGLTGIAEYAEQKRPKYILHGHLHEPSSEMHCGTAIRCCYRTEYFTLNQNL